jgi:hypothetical protein
VLDSPLVLQVRTALSWQKRWPAEQTTGAQAPLTHTWLLAAQSSTVVEERPSEEQTTTFCSVVAQPVVEGVQIQD